MIDAIPEYFWDFMEDGDFNKFVKKENGPFELDVPSWELLQRALAGLTLDWRSYDFSLIRLTHAMEVGGRIFQPGTYVKERPFSD